MKKPLLIMRELREKSQAGEKEKTSKKDFLSSPASQPSIRKALIDNSESQMTLAPVAVTVRDGKIDSQVEELQEMSIFDLSGKVLYSGRAHSFKELVAMAASDGKSLEYGDFRNADLQGLDLRECLISLAGADFSNTNLTGAKFDGSIMRGAAFQNAILDETSFKGCGLSRANFSHSKGLDIDFSQTRMDDIDIQFVQWTNPNFKDCEWIGQRKRQTKVDEETSELREIDFSFGAKVVGGKYHRAKIGEGVKQIKIDSFVNRTLTKWFKIIGVTGFGVAVMGLNAHGFNLNEMTEMGSEHNIAMQAFHEYGGMMTLLTVPSVYYGRELLGEKIADKIAETSYSIIDTIYRRMGSSHLVSTIDKQAEVIIQPILTLFRGNVSLVDRAFKTIARKREEKGLLGYFKSWAAGESGRIIVANKDHANDALYLIQKELTDSHIKDPLTIIRVGLEGDIRKSTIEWPVAMHIDKQGHVIFNFVNKDGETAQTIEYDDTGKPISSVQYTYEEIEGQKPKVHRKKIDLQDDVLEDIPFPTSKDAMLALAQGIEYDMRILDNASMRNLPYNPRTHYLLADDETGLICVKSRLSGKKDNPMGPAIIGPKGQLFYEDGKPISSLEEHSLNVQKAAIKAINENIEEKTSYTLPGLG